jgi:hypothetical protein
MQWVRLQMLLVVGRRAELKQKLEFRLYFSFKAYFASLKVGYDYWHIYIYSSIQCNINKNVYSRCVALLAHRIIIY